MPLRSRQPPGIPADLAGLVSGQLPDIRIEVEEQLSGKIVRALIDGVADLGVFAEDTPVFGLDVEPFQADHLVVVCAANHPLTQYSEIEFAACLAHDFVGLNRGSSLLELTSRAAERAGLPLRLCIQVRSFDAMCKMIAANLGIGVLALEACQAQIGAMGLHAIRLTDDWASRRLLIGTVSGRPLSAAAGLLRTHLLSQSGYRNGDGES